MKKVFLLFILISVLINAGAQDNVADIAHAFIKAVKQNELKIITPHFLKLDAAYAILPKASTGMSAKDKNDTYLLPLYEKFKSDFNNIQQQILQENITSNKIELVSYKMEQINSLAKEAEGKRILPQAMSLFFNYKQKEYSVPISVVEIDERWYILEILYTANLFK